ncbi:MAG: glycosyltransferase family 4 protein [Candidatus Nealsonbacteria bacterium]
MKTIGWIKISSRKYGGVAYEELAREALSGDFDVELVEMKSNIFKKGYLRAPEIILNLVKLKGERDLWVRDNNTIITLPFSRIKGKTLAMVHHIDFSTAPFWSKPLDLIVEKLIYFGLKKADFIVTVSKYWQEHFLKRGYKNVFKIYNAFNIPEYNFKNEEIAEFKKKYNLEGKPIIYLGSCQKAKGVLESYKALSGLNVHLITSGEPFFKSPARNLQVPYREYLKLLKASDIVLAMSKFKEGWCRVAHEAMLLKIPVVGSGLGGMRELLESGKQVVCPDFESLREKVEYLLKYSEVRAKMGEDGYNFAKDFTLGRFKAEWVSLVNKLL